MPEPADTGVHTQLGQILTQLAVISTKLDSAINTGTDHESRIRILETAKAKLIGAAAAAGTLSGGVATLIYWALTRR